MTGFLAALSAFIVAATNVIGPYVLFGALVISAADLFSTMVLGVDLFRLPVDLLGWLQTRHRRNVTFLVVLLGIGLACLAFIVWRYRRRKEPRR